MGEVPIAWTMEGGLRELHGGAGPQRVEDGAETGARRRATWSGGTRRRHGRERMARRSRCGGRFRRAVVVLCRGKLADPSPWARTAVDPPSVPRLSQRARPRRFTDCIDDADVLRTGGMAGAIGCMVKAPSTLGTFSFRWGHMRQLDRVSRELLAKAWAAGAGPGDAPLTIDLDSTICETYGLGCVHTNCAEMLSS